VEDSAAVEVPWEQLEKDILHKLVEEFVSREGTEYGETEVGLSTKVNQVVEQLKAKKATITFDPETQTTHIISKE
jgi:uncharacterized protein